MRAFIRKINGRLLSVALSAAVLAAFFTLAASLYVNSRQDAKQRATLCRAAAANRQVLRDLVHLIGPGEFRERADAIVNRRIPCEDFSE